jgi:uncharacterized protein
LLRYVVSTATHFEIYASEPEKLADFYRSLFGWQMEKVPGIDYGRIQIEPSHTNGFNGGLRYRLIPEPRSWCTTSTSISWNEKVVQVQQLGRAVLRPKTAMPRPPDTQFSQTRRRTFLPSGKLTRPRFHNQNRSDVRSDGLKNEAAVAKPSDKKSPANDSTEKSKRRF